MKTLKKTLRIIALLNIFPVSFGLLIMMVQHPEIMIVNRFITGFVIMWSIEAIAIILYYIICMYLDYNWNKY